MSVLWVVPVAVLAAGAAFLAVAARRLAAEVAALEPAAAGVRGVLDEARAARADVDVARQRAELVAGAPDRFRAARAAAREVRLGGTDR